ncbi:hypothetical protein BH10PLA1_BH10PLA1_16420 [soil metagenome]
MDLQNESISQQQLKRVLDLSRRLAVTTDLDAMLAHLVEAATKLLDCERASIFLFDAKTNQLWTKIALQSAEIRVPADAGIVGQAFISNTVIHVPKPYEDKRFNSEPDRRTGFVTRNLLTAPMVGLDQKPVGVIQAVNKRGDAFDESDIDLLQLLADHAGVAIQRFHLQQAAIQSVELRREMDLAKRVQQSMIPTKAPEVDGVNAIGWTRAASITGGDCFDLWTLPDGRLAIFLGDASGHGIGPAMVVSQVRTLIRALAAIELNPSKLLAMVNTRMFEDLQDGQFITVFFGLLDRDGNLEWTSAGQGPILVRASRGEPLKVLDTPGYPLGFTPAWPDAPGVPIRFQSGGYLFAASDGIYEAMDPDGNLFGDERVVTLLDGLLEKSPSETIDAVRSAVDTWQTKDEPNDDQTIVFVHKFA